MRYLKKINHFSPKEEIINEGLIYFSPQFKETLINVYRISNNQKVKDIASLIYRKHGNQIKDDITFVDLSEDKTEFVTHLKNNNLKKIDRLVQIDPNISSDTHFDFSVIADMWEEDMQNPNVEGPFNSPSRTEIRLSRLVNKIVDDPYYTTRDKENFVNEVRAFLEGSKNEFRVVSGEHIRNFYLEEHHANNSGSLQSSCMRHKKCSSYLDIYVNNPDVCQMLILININGKIEGRALLWNLYYEPKTPEINQDNPGKPQIGTQSNQPLITKFMDRIYCTNPSKFEPLFNAWARENGYGHKEENNFRNLTGVVLSNGKTIKTTLRVKCEGKYTEFPYVDTFRLYDPRTGILENSNDEEDNENAGKYILDRTDGKFKKIVEKVYSEWEDRYLPEDHAIYLESVDGWVSRRNVIRVDVGQNQGLYPTEHPDIKWDDYHDRYIHQNSCVCSQTTGRCRLSTEALVILDFDKDLAPDDDVENIFTRDFVSWDVVYPQESHSFWTFEDLRDFEWFKIWEKRFGKYLKNPQLYNLDFPSGSSPSDFEVVGIQTGNFVNGYLRLQQEEGYIGPILKNIYRINTYQASSTHDRYLDVDGELLGRAIHGSPKNECYIDYLAVKGEIILEGLKSLQNQIGALSETTDNPQAKKRIREIEKFFTYWGPYLPEKKE